MCELFKIPGFSGRRYSKRLVPTPFFGSRLRRQNFNNTIPPAAQAIRLYVDDDGTECKHKCKTVMFVRNKGFRNGSYFLSRTSNFIDDEEFLVLSDLFEWKNIYFPYEIIQLSTWMRWPSPSVCQSLDLEKETFWCDSCFPYKVYFLYIKDIWFALPKYVQINLSLTSSLARPPQLLSFFEVKTIH